MAAAGELVDGLPEYTKADVKKHNSISTGIWVRVSSHVLPGCLHR